MFRRYIVFSFFLWPIASEELRHVWHYDRGMAKVMKNQKNGSNDPPGINLTDFVVTRRQVAPSNRTKMRSFKIINAEFEGNNVTDEPCDLGGQHMRIAVSPQPPFVNCLQDLFGEWSCNGSNIEVIHVLEKKLNFQIDWVVLADGHHDDDMIARNPSPLSKKKASKGRPVEASDVASSSAAQTSSVFNLVATGRVLMSANGVMRTLDRSDHNLIVSEPFDSFKLHFLLSKSVRDHDHIFIKPFNPQAWLAILTSAALVVPIFYLINSTSFHYSIQDDAQLRKLSLWYCTKWRVKSLLDGRLGRKKRSSSSSSLEEELRKVFQTEIDEKPQRFGKPALGYELALKRPLPLPGESKRCRRLAMRQWSYQRRQAIKLGRKKRQSGFFKVTYIIWYVVASLANQGGETEDLPHANSTRVLVAFWWLYLIVICAIHSGILTAILTFPKQNDFIQTLDDYLSLEPADRNSLRLSVDKYSELAHLLVDFNNLHKSPLQLLQNQSVPIAFVNFQRHRQRILDEVQQGKNAFMEEKSIISQIISQEYYDSHQSRCLFKSSRYPIDVIPMSLILSKNIPSTCIRTINKTLKRIMKTGLAEKWRRNFESPGNDCLNSVIINAGDVDKIELKHVMLAIWLLALGSFIGLLFLVAEIAWLVMIEDESDEMSSAGSISDFTSPLCSSGSSLDSSSDESDNIRLGFRRAMMPSSEQFITIRSLQAKRIPVRAILRKSRKRNRRAVGPVPKIVLSADVFAADVGDSAGSDSPPLISIVFDEHQAFKEFGEFRAKHLEELRARRSLRQAERRAKRIQKTVDLFKRLHGGKIYSEKLKNRMRRMSHSVVSHLTLHSAASESPARDLSPTVTDPIIRRRQLLNTQSSP